MLGKLMKKDLNQCLQKGFCGSQSLALASKQVRQVLLEKSTPRTGSTAKPAPFHHYLWIFLVLISQVSTLQIAFIDENRPSKYEKNRRSAALKKNKQTTLPWHLLSKAPVVRQLHPVARHTSCKAQGLEKGLSKFQPNLVSTRFSVFGVC